MVLDAKCPGRLKTIPFANTTRVWPILVGLLGCCVIGCSSVYRSETVLKDDDRVERIIYQPHADTPESAKDPQKWFRMGVGPDPGTVEKSGWPASLKFFLDRGDPKGTYFVGQGFFASPSEIPAHIAFRGPEQLGVPPGELGRDYRRTDLGLVEEYVWAETLTDMVTRERMRPA